MRRLRLRRRPRVVKMPGIPALRRHRYTCDGTVYYLVSCNWTMGGGMHLDFLDEDAYRERRGDAGA